MGSLKFPHASGGSMSIASPATQPSTDLELKLPATIGTANQYLKNSSTAGTLEFGSIGDTGKILQVKVGEYATAESSTSTSYVNTSLNVSITPASTSNKIYITSQSPGWIHEEPGTDCLGYFAIYSSAASGRISEAAFGIHRGSGTSKRADIWTMQNFVYLDSPNTTSAITYTIQQKVINSGYQITHCHNDRKARIVVMEVAG